MDGLVAEFPDAGYPKCDFCNEETIRNNMHILDLDAIHFDYIETYVQ